MRAARIHEHGGPEVIRIDTDLEIPEPVRDEVRIAVKCTSINHLDLWIRRGMPGFPVNFPRILGSDCSGIVDAVGPDVTRVSVGDRVCINPGVQCGECEFCANGDGAMCLEYDLYGEYSNGTNREFICVPQRNIHLIPDHLSFEEAAAFPLTFFTAWRLLVTRAQVKPGDDVLILGAASGVGTACTQIAKLMGARVIATASTPEKLEYAREQGADIGINYTEQEFPKEIRSITNKRGVDVVVDYIGKDTWVDSLRALRRGGRLVTCGATSGHDPITDLRHVFFRQVEILGSTMGSYREFSDMMRCIRSGALKPRVAEVFPMEEISSAHQLLEDRGVMGKVILRVND
jgi:NADPH:quinone reductase-like Zn-dependent oxidoreductase